MKTAIGRYAQTEFANLKRRYKSDSHSEADIHAVIPAHTRAAPRRRRGAHASGARSRHESRHAAVTIRSGDLEDGFAVRQVAVRDIEARL